MMHEIWWSLPLTLIVFFLARKLAARFKFPLLNPLLVAMVVIIPFLLLTGISYERYFAGSKVLNDLLQPAVVALAFPLYEQLHQIRARWKSIITICFIGSCVAMITGTTVALLMGATPQIAASILPKSVTTPIAMAVSGSIGGIPAISAVCVIFVGIPEHRAFIRRRKLYMQGTLRSDYCSDLPEMTIKIYLPLFFNNRRVAGHSCNGINGDVFLYLLNIGRIK